MTSVERRRVRFQVVLGLLLTLLAVTMEHYGYLNILEHRLSDWRSGQFQYFSPPPTDRLVHLDITDDDLDAMGGWPWPRSVLAEVLDELTLAKAKAVGFDVLFTDRQGQLSLAEGTATGRAVEGDQDEALAKAIGRHGRVVGAISLPWRPVGPRPLGANELSAMLQADLELTPANAAARLRELGIPEAEVRARLEGDFATLREEAMRAKLIRELKADRGANVATLRRRLLPRTDPKVTNSPLITLLNKEYEPALALLESQRFTRPTESGMPPALETGDGLLPILPIARRLAGAGFAEFVPDEDPVIQAVPLWVTYRHNLMPHFGFALACAMLDVAPADARFEPGVVVLPTRERGELRIPVYTRHFERWGDAAYMLDVPWVGGEEWETMYDYPDYRERKQHIKVSSVWQLFITREKIRVNNASLDKAMLDVMTAAGIDPGEAPVEPAGDPDRPARIAGLADIAKGMAGHEDKRIAREMAAAADALVKIPPRLAQLGRDLAAGRAALRGQVEDRAVLVGWAATARTDFFPTPLHARCPGVVVHGAVFNAIMTGEFRHRAPEWVAPVLTGAVGLLATALVALLKPVRAMLSVLVLGTVVALTNALLLFDYGNLIVSLGGPLVSAGLVWSGVTLLGFVTEVAERGRITRRFRAYVDPTLVDYVVANPDRAAFEGHERELTVVFTDLKGFTALSEVLRGRVVKLLGRYIELMVPVIRRHNGYVNKFLGDGIMCFFGAPAENPRHAADALDAVLEMQGALQPLNVELAAQNLPTLSMRAGVSTGPMFVGDAGPSFASEFTVIGDRVNLGSRLESANKATGTRNLVTARTVELAGDRYLFRPIAKLKVVGKNETEVVYEALCAAADADDRARRLVRLTRAMFDAFQAGDLDRCRCAIEDLEREFGPDTLADLYRDRCNRGRDASRVWDGEIALTEK
jgi:class 3 adenylate cyclase/CHASE2 domain-containing sensor protein